MRRCVVGVALVLSGCGASGSGDAPAGDGAIGDGDASIGDSIGHDADATTDAIATDARDAADACPGYVADDPSLFDLDGDGTRESRLSIGACASGGTCLVVDSPLASTKSVTLDAATDACSGSVEGARVRAIGDHEGSALSEIAAVFCPKPGAVGSPSLAVVDVASGVVVARTDAPAGQKNAWIDAVKDPSGKLHPFLAPSYGDAVPVDPTYGAGATWGYLCVFRGGGASDPSCGTGAGFVHATSAAAGDYFREVGGVLQDLDGDGWEDVTLIFHQQVLALSGQNGAHLDDLVYDVAESTEPSSPKWFHSGRNYGTHSAYSSSSGALRTVIVGGTPVGSFTDYNCNVSRFVAVLESAASAPATRRLAWSRYVGFASTIFSVIDPSYAADPSPVVSRRGNFVDGCVRRFDDARTIIDGKESVLYDVFHGATVATCLVEQYALYLGDPADPDPEKRPWSPSKQKAWGDCQTANLKAKGTWAMVALATADGNSVTGSVQTYVWGWSDAITPGGEIVYLVENLPAETAFDLSDVAPSKLVVESLVKGLWTPRGTLPVAGRPKLRSVPEQGAKGMGAYSGYAELTLADVDCDGVQDVQLDDGTWVGWSKGTSSFVAK